MIEGTGNIGVEFSGSGIALSDNSRPPKLFKIVSGSNPYTATPVNLFEDDGTRPDDGATNVTAAMKMLYEVNGATSVAVDTVVEATPNPNGSGWYFTAPFSGAVTNTWAILGTTLSLTGVSGAWNDVTSISITPGTWIVNYTLAGILDANTTQDNLVARLYPGTGIGYAYMKFCTCQVVNKDVKECAAGWYVVTVGSTTTMKVQAAYEYTGAAPNQADIIGNSSVYASGLWAIKVA